MSDFIATDLVPGNFVISNRDGRTGYVYSRVQGGAVVACGPGPYVAYSIHSLTLLSDGFADKVDCCCTPAEFQSLIEQERKG